MLPKPIAILAVSCPPYLVAKAVVLWCLDSMLSRQGIIWECQTAAFASVLVMLEAYMRPIKK